MKLDKWFKKIDVNRIFWIVLCALLVIILFHSLNRFFDHDEFEAVHTSWKILQGQKIYVDFFQHHHPFLYYLLIPIIKIFGESINTIVTARLIIFLMLLLILFVTYLIARYSSDREVGIISLLLVCSTLIFVSKVVEIRPNVPQTLFSLVSILFLLLYIQKRVLLYSMLSAFFLGVAFLFFQLTLFLCLLIGIFLLFRVYERTIYFRDVIIYLSIFLLTIIPYGLYLFYSGAFYGYFQLNWILNMKILNSFSPFDSLQNIYTVNTVFFIFYIIGLIFFMKTSEQKLLGILSIGLLLSVFIVRTPWPQYFMLAIPLIAIMSAHAIRSIFKNSKALLFIVVILSIGSQIPWLAQGARNSNRGQLEKIAYVLSTSNRNDFVYDGHILFNIFRKDLDFFWYSIDRRLGTLETYRTMTDYHYDIYEIIDRVKPKIISNYYIANMDDPRIKNHYERSKQYADLFIRVDSK